MAADDIGSLYNTKIPGYEDAADIQDALKLYHYGTTTVPTVDGDIIANSIAGHLKSLRVRIEDQEDLGIGSTYSAVKPPSPEEGFIWVDSESNVSSSANYAAAVYSPVAPTTDLVDGLIWVDKDANPARGYIYDAGISDWVAITEIPGIFDAAGDLIYGAGADDIAKLSIGTTGQILKVSSGVPAWSDQKTWVLKGSGTLSGSAISVSGLNGEKLFIALHNWSHDDATDSALLAITFNNNTGPNYINTGGLTAASSLRSPTFNDTAVHDITITVDLANSTSVLKPVSTIADNTAGQYFGYFRNNSPITSVQVTLSPTGSFDSGTYEVWSYE